MMRNTVALAMLAMLLAGPAFAADVWVLKSVRVPANDDIAEVSRHSSHQECQAAAKQYDKTHPGRKAGCFKK